MEKLICKACKASFNGMYELEDHIRAEHLFDENGKKKLVCVLCGQLFNSTGDRHAHIKTEHHKRSNIAEVAQLQNCEINL